MKAKAIREHQEYSMLGHPLTSAVVAIASIVKYIAVIVGVALMVFS